AIVDIFDKVRGRSLIGAFHYQPVIVSSAETATAIDKQTLGFFGHLLSVVQGRSPTFGKIVVSRGRKSQLIRLPKRIGDAKRHLQALIDMASEPVLRLNKHCKVCEFQTHCRKRAQEKNDLSLFSGMAAKEVESLNRRGIFTITQLSHKFRPQRRHKGMDFRR